MKTDRSTTVPIPGPASAGEPPQARAPVVVLVSGGLDSATVLALARSRGHTCHALSVDYGQRHRCELDAARAIARSLGALSHRVVTLDPSALSGSALTGGPEVPKDRPDSEIASTIPTTYVPARNLVMLSLAVGLAEVLGARDVHIGVNAMDYSGYPDCRPEFVEAFAHAAKLGTRDAVHVRAPLVSMTKARIIRVGLDLGVDYSATVSCYDPDDTGRACGRCDACALRRRGFEEAGCPDPTRYVS